MQNKKKFIKQKKKEAAEEECMIWNHCHRVWKPNDTRNHEILNQFFFLVFFRKIWKPNNLTKYQNVTIIIFRNQESPEDLRQNKEKSHIFLIVKAYQ